MLELPLCFLSVKLTVDALFKIHGRHVDDKEL